MPPPTVHLQRGLQRFSVAPFDLAAGLCFCTSRRLHRGQRAELRDPAVVRSTMRRRNSKDFQFADAGTWVLALSSATVPDAERREPFRSLAAKCEEEATHIRLAARSQSHGAPTGLSSASAGAPAAICTWHQNA